MLTEFLPKHFTAGTALTVLFRSIFGCIGVVVLWILYSRCMMPEQRTKVGLRARPGGEVAGVVFGLLP